MRDDRPPYTTNPVGRPPSLDPANVRKVVNMTAGEWRRLDALPGRSRREKILRLMDAQPATTGKE